MANWHSQSGEMYVDRGPDMDKDAHAHLVSALQEEIARQEAAFPDVLAEVDDTNMMLQMGTPRSAELMDNISQLRSQGFLVGMNPETLANKIESGDEAFSGYLNTALERWNPSYRGDDATINQYQDKIMAHDGYGGMGWLPHELKARDGVVGTYEPSSGGAIRNQLDARKNYLMSRMDGNTELSGYQNYQDALEPYNPYAIQNLMALPQSWDLERELFNPENILGGLLSKTQMGFMPETASYVGDQALGADIGMNPIDAATTRSFASDINRTHPQMRFDAGWRKNDDFVNGMRESFTKSEGMPSGEFIKRLFGEMGMEYGNNVVSDLTVNPLLTVGNGMTDMTAGALDDIIFDLGLGGVVGGAGEAGGYAEKGEAFPQHVPYKEALPEMQAKDKERGDSLRQLDNNADKFVHHSAFGDDTEHDAMLALDMAKNAWTGAQNAIAGAIEPVVGAVDEGLTKAQKIAKQAAKSYRPPLGNAIPR